MSAEIHVTKKFEFYCYLEEKGTSPFCRSQEKAQASRADPGARLTSATWNRAGVYQVPVTKLQGQEGVHCVQLCKAVWSAAGPTAGVSSPVAGPWPHSLVSGRMFVKTQTMSGSKSN